MSFLRHFLKLFFPNFLKAKVFPLQGERAPTYTRYKWSKFPLEIALNMEQLGWINTYTWRCNPA